MQSDDIELRISGKLHGPQYGCDIHHSGLALHANACSTCKDCFPGDYGE